MRFDRPRFGRAASAALLFLAGLIGLPASLRAQNSVVWATNYYVVTGQNAGEIRASIDGARRRATAGDMDGVTEWKIEWHFATQPTATGCRCTAFNTRTTIAVTLPRWQAPTNAEVTVTQAWTRYIAGLGAHEAGHAQIALAAAAEMHAKARAAAEPIDCDALTQKLNSLAQGIIKSYQAREQAYDERTRHGITQGAVLWRRPPGEGRRPE